MEEGLTRPIGEFDEPKALLGIEPLDDAPNWRAGRCLEPGLDKAGASAEGMGLWVVGIGVEVATPRMTKILLSHFGSWGVCLLSSVGRRLDLSPV
jgi:hypothetical protein